MMTELIRLVDEQLASNTGANPVAESRRKRLGTMKRFPSTRGFPSAVSDKASLSLVPFLFQEANYDGIHWSGQHEPLDHLAPLFEIDARVMNGGKSRKDLSSAEFERYLGECYRIIDLHKA